MKIKIGSRKSALALAQINWVKDRLAELCPECDFEIVKIMTKGDQILDRPLAKIGGKGLFIKEIEQALLEKKIDLAVHSMKDMPADLPEGLIVGAVTTREDPRDALITQNNLTLDQLPLKARIGTSSLRRKAQLLAYRPDLEIVPLRGNINTRLRKLTEENLDGIVLAAAGLSRDGMAMPCKPVFGFRSLYACCGPGALAIEIRKDDSVIESLVGQLDHSKTKVAVNGERGFLERLEGSCHIPVGAYGQCQDEQIILTGFLASTTGDKVIRETIKGDPKEAYQLGVALAETILKQGGTNILDEWNL